MGSFIDTFLNYNEAIKAATWKNQKNERNENMSNVNWENIVKTTKKFLTTQINEADTNSKFINERNLIEAKDIIIPNRMDLYTGLDITEKDKIFVKSKFNLLNHAMLVNGENYICAFFNLINCNINDERQTLLTASAKNINFDNHTSSIYYFVFCDDSGKLYKVPIEVQYQQTKTFILQVYLYH